MHTKVAPLTNKIQVSVTPPDSGDNTADWERVKRKIEHENIPAKASLNHIQLLSDLMRNNNWQIFIWLGYYGSHYQVIDIASAENNNLGLAIDLGSTTISGNLIDLTCGKTIATANIINGQVKFGEDILERIFYAKNKNGLFDLQKEAVNSLNDLVLKLSRDAGKSVSDIKAATIAGNTTMVHFLLGLKTDNLYREPHVPVINNPGILPASEIKLDIHPAAPVYLFPNVGSYLGGDVISGITFSGINLSDEISALVDIGTNGEIIVGNREWLVGCAGAAGPALEGGVVKCGMRAAPGAIESIEISSTGKIKYATIGNKAPAGICGSGLISCIAQLFLRGIINHSGSFQTKEKEFVIVPSQESAHGNDIVITEADISNFLRTKAAVNAAFTVVLENLGISFHEISTIFIAGAFGEHLAIEDAVTLGLLPDIDRKKFVIVGNSSLKGANKVLLDKKRIEEAEDIAKKITYLELNSNNSFMKHFTSGLFIPHTELDLYPSVKEKLKK